MTNIVQTQLVEAEHNLEMGRENPSVTYTFNIEILQKAGECRHCGKKVELGVACEKGVVEIALGVEEQLHSKDVQKHNKLYCNECYKKKQVADAL